MGQTVVEKVLSRATGRRVSPGEVIYPVPDLLVTHETVWVDMVDEIRSVGIERLRTPDKLVLVFDHDVPVTTARGAERARRARSLAREMGVRRVYDLGDGGIEHQLLVQAGEILPGMLVLTMDQHSLNFGAVGAVAVGVTTEFPVVLATGTIPLEVPPTIRVNVSGATRNGVMARDVAAWVSAEIGCERADYRAVEFGGPTVRAMSVDARMVLCNVATEIDVMTAQVEPDEVSLSYVRSVAYGSFEAVWSDPDAAYEAVFDLDISDLGPVVAAPPGPSNVVPVAEVVGMKIDQAFIGSCASGTIEELRAAAAVLEGHHVRPGVRLIVSPGTQRTFRQAAAEGLLAVFADAGALVSMPACGYCYGSLAPLAAGEVSISTATRNDPGRLGSFAADIYLASPITVAASALAGEIADPRAFLSGGGG